MTAISAIGTANPPYRANQEEVFNFMSDVLHLSPAKKRIYKSIFKATGIEHRYTVLNDHQLLQDQSGFFPKDNDAAFPSTAARMQQYKQTALPVVLKAVEDCFSNLTAFETSSITHLIVISCTGMYTPGLDIELLNALKLPTNTKRTCIHFMGCYASFNGLKMANDICKSDPNAKILMVSVEICSLHFQKKDELDDLMSSALFADGAAAVLIEATPSQSKYLKPLDFYCDIVPDTHHEMSWDIGDTGFNMVLTGYVPHAVESGINVLLQKILSNNKLTLDEIDFYAIHPGGFKILQACENSLGITPEDNKHSYHVLRNYGNMSSATVLFVLKSLWNSLEKKDHQRKIFSCAFGPGLTLESSLLQLHYV